MRAFYSAQEPIVVEVLRRPILDQTATEQTSIDQLSLEGGRRETLRHSRSDYSLSTAQVQTSVIKSASSSAVNSVGSRQCHCMSASPRRMTSQATQTDDAATAAFDSEYLRNLISSLSPPALTT